MSGSLRLPAGLTKISDNTFLSSYLESIWIPRSVTVIGNNAFCRGNIGILQYEGTQEEWEMLSKQYIGSNDTLKHIKMTKYEVEKDG